ncbi:phosphate acyltransferase PlsX [Acetobacterium wieringae]|uniref:Phosphate acyltransferase n=1 Tax=Acetobacterium wieringae TaxID=52694 RepID=A0A1F2PNV5_9FIRM|nr:MULTISPECIES: phosphate acyltransferase PlsX [Acetobacterium]OFV72421.1 phosphate acyltransferase [Acetobacterium wieringae]OXS25499.1 MAG: phosphate acyltransferase [Acetobacterium sp. MES1]TYC88395.1 phosphate acyltransferase PlsX [Acetobacterium wieringae]URN82982.1 phosphate acyltransferase PlsX [Acetobacterium wieringae]UYO61359.1 phosphate acyltransferase PlsX [Acetobacterium wieringae]
MNIFLDAMGGDHAPYEIVKGAIDAVKEYDVKLTLVGHRQAVLEELSKYDYPKDKIEILHAETVIENTEEPAMAIRRKPDSSLVVALDEMKKRENAVLISAGSTGALLSGGLLKLGRIKGIKRPALAATLPKSDGVFVLIDTGANADCKPEYLEQFAQLGKIYSENVLGKNNPGIGLINIGAEAKKGNSLVKAAYELLETGDFNFLGNVEARDLPETKADVLVCDGFTGNIVLKLTEGIAAYLLKGMKTSIMSNTKGKIGGMLIKDNLRSFKKQFDYAEYGGAPFLGVKGGIIKAHGSSDAFAIKNAIRQSMKFIENDVLQKITDNVKNMEA